MNRNFSLVVADDHPVVRMGIKVALQCFPNVLIHDASNGEELFDIVKKHKPDVAIMDINMPETDSQGVLLNMLRIQPDLGVLMFSVNKEEVYGKAFLTLGARGYLEKENISTELSKAILCVLDGNVYMRKEMQAFYLGGGEIMSSVYSSLTKRELDILKYLIKGDSIVDIASVLNLSPSTIGTHKAHIFDKLRVSNYMELKEVSSLHPIS